MVHRRAYFPRLWPTLIPAALVVGTAAFALRPSTLWAVFLGVAVGSVVMNVRLWVWRRRHPVITPHQYLDDLRKSATWN